MRDVPVGAPTGCGITISAVIVVKSPGRAGRGDCGRALLGRLKVGLTRGGGLYTQLLYYARIRVVIIHSGGGDDGVNFL